MQKDSTTGTISVAGILCIVCSILVSAAAVNLRPIQESNKKLDVQKKLLLIAGLIDNPKASKSEVETAFKMVETKLIDLESGEEVTDMDPEDFDQKAAHKDPKQNKKIDPALDFAKIRARSKISKVYFIRKNGSLDQIVLPVHGKGLWSTMYGLLALAPDTKTVKGFGFYQHGETPGLGGEIDNPRWRASWTSKVVYDENYNPVLRVLKGLVNSNHPEVIHQVDGLSGATLTSNGVTGLIKYWMGNDGYGPYLSKLREGR